MSNNFSITKDKIKAAKAKLIKVFPQDLPEELLFWGVVETALDDLLVKDEAEDARDFLLNGCWPAVSQGISQDYINRVLTKMGIV